MRFHLTGRLMAWAGFAATLIVLPLIVSSDFSLSLLSRMGISIIFALSFNMLLGQGGMLSFGHAVYSGLGAYFTIHALNAVGSGSFPFPVTLLPLVGGIAGLFFSLLFGWVTTKRSGTPFAMISLGIGELVTACVLLIPAFFGGEAGVAGNRVAGEGWFGITYGSQRQVYYLVAGWTLVCALGMYYITRTPLGRMSNAVRDNPERVQFIGYDTHLVRFMTLSLAGFFAGVSGGLVAINFEIVTVETVTAHTSGAVLLMAFIGGVGQFFGPIIGAVVVTLLETVLSEITSAWVFYFGLLFLVMVMFAPGGISSLVVMHAPLLERKRLFKTLLPGYLFAGVAGGVMLLGAIGLVEMSYHLSRSGAASTLSVFGLAFNPRSAPPWVVAGLLVAVGAWLMRLAATQVSDAWSAVTAALHASASDDDPEDEAAESMPLLEAAEEAKP